MTGSKNLYVVFLLLIILLSCGEKERSLKLLKVTEYSSSKVTDTSLVSLLKDKHNLDIDIEYTLSEDEALDLLKDKKVDLVIIPNNARSPEVNFRTLIPLLPRVLVILTNKRVDTMDAKDLFEKATVYFEDRSRLDSIIFRRLYYNYNIDEKKIDSRLSEDIDLNGNSDSLEVYVGLTHLNNVLVRKLTNLNWYFYSMGDIDYYGKGSRIEGFTMMNTSGYPFIIPMSIYRGKPKNSILTFAINDILISRDDLDERLAYEITGAIIENKSHLTRMNNVYNLLNFDYNKQVLSFPLHRGTKKYLNKNDPPVWFKYVKMVWPLISISVVVFGIIASFRTRLRKRKKQNIEMYYNDLIKIRDDADSAEDLDTYVSYLKQLKNLRSEAMKSLANKKLDPGESFNIFLALYNEIRDDFTDHIKTLRLKEQES